MMTVALAAVAVPVAGIRTGIKIMKIIFMPPYKSWFKGLGLHHASIALIPCAVGYCLAFMGYVAAGVFVCAGGLWWYASREWGWGVYPPKTFEIMDFVSPAGVSLAGLALIIWQFG